MRLEWIEDILAVHDAGSLRAAADLRLLTASAFTRRIKVVEASIGADIFDRSNKPVTLRPHVVELIPRLREVAASIRQVQSELSDLGRDAQLARLACQHTLSITWAPKVARKLASMGAQMRIRSGSKDECSFSVLKNNTDFAIVYVDPETDPKEEADLFDRMRFSAERFIPVGALRDNSTLRAEIELRRIPIIAYPRTLFLGEVLERALAKHAPRNAMLSTIAESGLGPAVLEFVREGLGVGWLPRSIVEKEISSGQLNALTDLLPTFDLDVVAIKAKGDATRHVRKIWAALEEGFSETGHPKNDLSRTDR